MNHALAEDFVQRLLRSKESGSERSEEWEGGRNGRRNGKGGMGRRRKERMGWTEAWEERSDGQDERTGRRKELEGRKNGK